MEYRNIKFKIYYTTLFKAIVLIKRFIGSKIKSNRTFNYPFISGDAFRSIAQHIMDDISDIRPEMIMENDVVFVRTDMLDSFFDKILNKVKHPFVLITHNADNNIDDKYLKYDLSKIKVWFAQNKLIEHPKILSLPIGLSNSRYKSGLIKQLKTEVSKNRKENYRILSAFNPETNPVRKAAERELEKTSLSNQFKGNQMQYFEEIAKYSFVASPEGNGIDCHRTWEALYWGAIPIVTRNAMTEELSGLGIPLLLIDSWDDLSELNEDYLREKYLELEPKLKTEKIYIDYWFRKITSHNK